MKIYRMLLCLILGLGFVCSGVFAEVYNEKGDFSVSADSLTKSTYNDDIITNFYLEIKNNNNYVEDINLNIAERDGWNILLAESKFSLMPQESKKITLRFETTSDFDYGKSVISPDMIKISQKENYVGTFTFPLLISGNKQNVTLNFKVDIENKEKADEEYSAKFSTQSVSPNVPLSFAIKADNLEEEQKVSINLEFAGISKNFNDEFSKDDDYKIYSLEIPASISPGTYYAKVTIRLDKPDSDIVWEWNDEQNVKIATFSKLKEDNLEKKTFLVDKYNIVVTNLGNVDEDYSKSINISYLKSLILNSNTNYRIEDGVLIFNTMVKKGDSVNIEYRFNYLPIYLITLIVLVLGSYLYVRKTSNPLDVEVKIYEINRVEHEGVKSIKVRIGFENIKEHEIENIKLIFRMPSYLNVKDNSFLLTEPNQVLKGRNQYKLIWDFKRFEQNESRILGLALINNRGILGDIKIPDLEFELKTHGKIKRYFKSFPTIKG